MDIHWLGHSAVRIRPAGQTTTLLMDPYGKRASISPAERVAGEPDVATFSNGAENHSSRNMLGRGTVVLETAGEYGLNGLLVRAAMTPLAEEQTRKERNVAFSVSADGITVCHLGNIRTALAGGPVDMLGPVDILFVPTPKPNVATLATRDLIRTAQQLEAKIVVPIHGTGEDIERFIREAGGNAETETVARLTPAKTNLPDGMEIRKMEPQTAGRRR